MKNAAVTYLLIVVIEVASAVLAYLKERLTDYIRRGDDNAYDPDFAAC